MKSLGAFIILVLVLVSPINAQTAKVIALSSADAAEVKDLYAQRDAINKKIEETRKKITDKYLSDEKPGFSSGFITLTCGMILSVNGHPSECPPETAGQKKAREEQEAKEKLMHHLERKQGWSDFEFSEDFKFVVPKEFKSIPTCSIWGNGTTLVPAYTGSNEVGRIKNY